MSPPKYPRQNIPVDQLQVFAEENSVAVELEVQAGLIPEVVLHETGHHTCAVLPRTLLPAWLRVSLCLSPPPPEETKSCPRL